MTDKFFIVTTTCLLLSLEIFSSEPDELSKLKDQFVAARTTSADDPLNTKLENLETSYLKALDRAIEASRAEGDLDAIVNLRDEVERISTKDQQRPNYDSEKAANLVKAYFDRYEKIYIEDKQLRLQLTKKLQAALEDLQGELTRDNRIDDALKVKGFATSDGFNELVIGEALIPGNTDLKPYLSTQSAKTTDSPPIVAPNEASAETRVVIIPEDPNLPIPPSFTAIGSADMKDIVFIGRSVFPNVGMIRRDGALVWWESGALEPDIYEGSHTFCIDGSLVPFVGIKDNGTLTVSKDADATISSALEGLSEVTDLMMTTGIVVAVQSNGQITVVGSNANKLVGLLGYTDIKQVNFAGASAVSVLHNDGTVTDMSAQMITTPNTDGDIIELYRARIGLNDDGEVVSWAGMGKYHLDEAGKFPKHVICDGNAFAAIRKDDSFLAMSSGSDNQWNHLSDVEDALDGALSASWLIRGENRWILAVLPADSVPRSGVWKADELAAARASNSR